MRAIYDKTHKSMYVEVEPSELAKDDGVVSDWLTNDIRVDYDEWGALVGIDIYPVELKSK